MKDIKPNNTKPSPVISKATKSGDYDNSQNKKVEFQSVKPYSYGTSSMNIDNLQNTKHESPRVTRVPPSVKSSENKTCLYNTQTKLKTYSSSDEEYITKMRAAAFKQLEQQHILQNYIPILNKKVPALRRSKSFLREQEEDEKEQLEKQPMAGINEKVIIDF